MANFFEEGPIVGYCNDRLGSLRIGDGFLVEVGKKLRVGSVKAETQGLVSTN